ncbi:MAG: DUF4838 domain-containing protein, partial [Planctomycetota bacterium]
MPPTNFPTLAPNVGITYCQTRAMDLIRPEQRQALFRERDAWLKKIPSGQFFTWEYYLYHLADSQLPGVPVIFTKVLQEDMRALRGKSKGEYTECWSDQGKILNPGLNHLTYYLHARLYWEPDLDLDAFMAEYCRLFYGPAASAMREFFEFAETVWMRPASRDVYAADGFLKPADVEHYFEILARAKAAAGDNVYGRRIDLISAECQPMKDIFAFSENYERGLAAAKAGDGTTAEACLRKAVACAQDNRSRADASYELGHVCVNLLKDDEKALAAYLQAM